MEEKIKSGKNPVQDFFPDCPGNDYESAETYFRELFVSQNPNPEERHIYPHSTCMVDCNNIKVVDTAVQQTIQAEIWSTAFQKSKF